jgi:hypothetical protein
MIKSIITTIALSLFAISQLFANDTVLTNTVKSIDTVRHSSVDTEQKILFQFEGMMYQNWEGSGFNYVAGSFRYIGNYNQTSEDSTFRWRNNAEAIIGTAYNSTDKWKLQENRISATSSANQKFFSDSKSFLNHLNINGTADLKSRFDLEANYLLAALGASFIKGELVIQNNPITLRTSLLKNEKSSFEFGNYFRIAWKGAIDTNITTTIKLENFYKYGHSFWRESYWNLETMTSFQISKIVTSHIVLCALYDLNQSKKLQAYQKITLGFTWKLS